jgi:hypothetical protein
MPFVSTCCSGRLKIFSAFSLLLSSIMDGMIKGERATSNTS